jgi:CRISPR-associated protein Cas5d
VVDRIHVLRPIRFQSLRRNEVGSKAKVPSRAQMADGRLDGLGLRADTDRQQRAATILTDVAYVIEAHFTMTARAGAADTEGKHLDMFNRRAAKGQCFHQPCLGTREFPAAFELIAPGSAAPEPSGRTPDLGFGAPRDLGLMLWDIDHAGGGSVFFRARLGDGVMEVPPPGSLEVLR